MKFKFLKQKKYNQDIAPDEIFLDSANLPGFDNDMFEGRIEKPIKKFPIILVGFIFLTIILFFGYRTFALQIAKGDDFIKRSEKNVLRHTLIFSDRGLIYDRNQVPLAWNIPATNDLDFNLRKYIDKPGMAHVLGYVNYPQKDKAGFYYDTDISGVEGIEKKLNEILSGKNGLKIIETDALNKIISNSAIEQPQNGKNITLTIDSQLQEKLFNSIKNIVDEHGFVGGGGVIMDIYTGEIIALTSYPEFDPNKMLIGDKESYNSFLNDSRKPFLNRITQGLYTPGSIVKPYVAAAALQEKIITPFTQILSVKNMIVPNPYNPDNPSIFTDWKAHGLVDVRKALAVSSNVFFYQIGGGYGSQKGLGITLLEKYLRDFGFGEIPEDSFFGNLSGTIPNPEWKQKIFEDDWRLGDTYFTSIGQYGMQVTPIQIIRVVSVLANGGDLIEPKIVKDDQSPVIDRKVSISNENLKIVREGMRMGVMSGTASGLNYPDFEIAAKTGTAELGISKEDVNSWTIGFFPYNNPKYAFVIVMERGNRNNTIGGIAVARQFFDWLKFNAKEYIQ
jgi:penicillin-binding protein 2